MGGPLAWGTVGADQEGGRVRGDDSKVKTRTRVGPGSGWARGYRDQISARAVSPSRVELSGPRIWAGESRGRDRGRGTSYHSRSDHASGQLGAE